MVRKILLGCGIASSVLYVVSDVIGNLLYEGYTHSRSILVRDGAESRR